jgi:hypothetical protein
MPVQLAWVAGQQAMVLEQEVKEGTCSGCGGVTAAWFVLLVPEPVAGVLRATSAAGHEDVVAGVAAIVLGPEVGRDGCLVPPQCRWRQGHPLVVWGIR